jgi:hypothetical protein
VWCGVVCGAGHRVLCAVWCSLPDRMAFRASTACTLRAEGDRTSWRSRAVQREREENRYGKRKGNMVREVREGERRGLLLEKEERGSMCRGKREGPIGTMG